MRRAAWILAFLGVAVLASCAGHGTIPRFSGPTTKERPRSVSPALVKPAPMAKTAILPASAMRSPGNRRIDGMGLSWGVIPGTASYVAASGDGSLWALSDQPSGADKYIWHYANGTWTNISGMATQIATSLSGAILYAINSGGGLWEYSVNYGQTWSSLGGGARALAVVNDGMGDGTPYVLSNGGPGPDYAIWKYPGGYGPWQQVNGSGTGLGGSFGTGSYSVGGQSVNSGGVYILNSVGGIWYENPDGTFAQFPGGASGIAPTPSGGVFVLGYPAGSQGDSIYYYYLPMPGWLAENGSAVDISTDWSTLYAVGPSGGIYDTSASGMVFGGGSETQTFTSSGGTLMIPASGNYDGISGSMQWGANSASGSFPFTVSWAMGSDLPPTFTTLPVSIGTPLVYLDLVVGTTTSITFNQTPTVTVSDTSALPGTMCGFAVFGTPPNGGAYQWMSMATFGLSEVAPSGNSFTVPAATLSGGRKIQFYRGEDTYIAPYCH